MHIESDIIASLFDKVQNCTFFVKDRKGRFLAVNKKLLSILKCSDENEVLNKTDFNFFPKHIAEDYRRDDNEVLRSKHPKLNIVELIPNKNGQLEWYITHKYPLFSKTGACIGLCGICLKTESSHLANIYPPPLAKTLLYISKNYSRAIRIDELARVSKQSARTLERSFKKIFGKTITRYIAETRVNAVIHFINNSNMSLSEIAQACGFCDQSYMSKEFKKQVGIAPKSYSLQIRR